jgi:hypothetical protein
MVEDEGLHQRQPATLSGPVQWIAWITAVLISLTSSFDIFMVVNAGGNYRFCQIITPVLVALAILKAACGKPRPVLGATPLLIWFLFQCAFIPSTGFWPKSLGYCLWLALNLALVFSCVQLFSDNAKALAALLRWYVYSFGLIATFGIVQFTLPALGLPGIYITQWWVEGDFPRANGFSYEPSYFATYLLIGFVFVASLRRQGSTLLSTRMLTAVYWLTIAGIVVSSSRMGILFLVLYVVLTQLAPWLSLFRDARKCRVSFNKVRAVVPSVVLVACIAPVTTVAVMVLQRNPAVALMFLSGTGISDTAAHSVIEREDSLEETLNVFLNHPVIGRSLGGVSWAIADLNGVSIHSFEESKEFEGMSVFAEVLAASGVIGFVPFVWFLVVSIRKPLKLSTAAAPFYSILLRALIHSLVFAWAILQFNQNLLRPYLWVHLAVLACVYAAARQSVLAPAEAKVAG